LLTFVYDITESTDYGWDSITEFVFLKPSKSVTHFVNIIAEFWPDKIISYNRENDISCGLVLLSPQDKLNCVFLELSAFGFDMDIRYYPDCVILETEEEESLEGENINSEITFWKHEF